MPDAQECREFMCSLMINAHWSWGLLQLLSKLENTQKHNNTKLYEQEEWMSRTAK